MYIYILLLWKMPGEDTSVGINPSVQQWQSTWGSQWNDFVLDFWNWEEQSVVSTSSDEESIINAVSDNETEDESFKDFDISMWEDSFPEENTSDTKEVKEEEKLVDEEPVEEPEVGLDLSDTTPVEKEEVKEEEKLVDEEPVENMWEEMPIFDWGVSDESNVLNNNALSNLTSVSYTETKEDANQFSKDKLMDELALLDNNSASSSQNVFEESSDELNDKLKDDSNIEGNNQNVLESQEEYNVSQGDSVRQNDIKDTQMLNDETLSSDQKVAVEIAWETIDETKSDLYSSDQWFVLDYEVEQEKSPENGTLNVVVDETESWVNSQQPTESLESGLVDNNQESTEPSHEIEVQSTLSLDQILDSELLSGQQFADNSVAVPVNKTETTWNKKLVAILTWIGLFALIWSVAALAFPWGNNTREDYQIVEEDQTKWDHWTYELERPDTDNNPEVTGEVEEFTNNQENIDEYTETMVNNVKEQEFSYNAGVLNSNNNSTTSSVVFPDVWEEDQYDLDPSSLEPAVYTWYTENWIEEPKENDNTPTISIKEANDLISSFKSQAEVYHTYGQENEDRYLIKYAAKIIYLCNTYSEELKDWENVDVERLEWFKTEVNWLISKIESHNNWWWDEPVLVQPTNEGSSNFEWKDEIKDYLYSKS